MRLIRVEQVEGLMQLIQNVTGGAIGNYLPLSGGTLTGNLRLGNLGGTGVRGLVIDANGNVSASNDFFTVTRLRATSGGTYISGDLTLSAGTNVSLSQNGQNIVISSTDTNTTYTAGNGLSLAGTAFSLPVTVSGSGSFVQSVTQTTSGITVTLGTPPNTNTDTTYTAGNGLSLNGTVFSLPVTTTGSGNVVDSVVSSANGISVTKNTTAMTTSHPANGITSANITNWNASYGWGDHSGLYPLRGVLGGNESSIRVKDTRSTNPLPSTDLRSGVWFDFKQTSAIGLSGLGQGTYSSTMTFVPYGDDSGNSNSAFTLAQSNNNLYFRNYGTSWGTWNRLVTNNNIGDYLPSTTRLRSNGNAYVSGDITLTAGSNVTLSQSGNVITVNATNTNTTYNAGTLALLNTGTDAENRVWSASAIRQFADGRYLTLTGNAQTASQLQTARTIGLHQAISGTPTSFNGSANISIPVTEVKEAFITNGGRNQTGTYSAIDSALISNFSANRFAFMPPNAITVQYSRDNGATWVNYAVGDDVKINLFSNIGTYLQVGGGGYALGTNYTNYKLRIEIDNPTSLLYTDLNKIATLVSSNGSTGCYMKITGQAAVDHGTNNWIEFTNMEVSGWSGWNIANTHITTFGGGFTNQIKTLRFEFGQTGYSTDYSGLVVLKILGFGGVGWTTPSTMAANGNLYTYDYQQNAIFPKFVTSVGYNKVGSNNSYVLLGGGGHKLISELSGSTPNLQSVTNVGNVTTTPIVANGISLGGAAGYLRLQRQDGNTVGVLNESNGWGNIQTNQVITNTIKWTGSTSTPIGVVSDESTFHNYGNGYGYGISTNIVGGLDIMANQSNQPIRLWSGGTNTNPIRSATINGLNAQFHGVIHSDGYGNSTQWNDAYNWGNHKEYNAQSSQQYLGANYVSGGDEKPNYFGAGKLKLQMLNSTNVGTTGGWMDVLWMSSYNGGDVKGSNALMFGKQTPKVGFAFQNYDSTSWGTYYELYGTHNFNPLSYVTRLRSNANAYVSGDVTLTAGSNVTLSQSGNVITVSATDSNTTYTAGNGLTLSGTQFSLPVTVTGSGTYVQSVTQTSTGITVTLGTPPNTNTDTTYTAGNGLTLSGTQFSLPVTVSGSGTYVQSVTQTTNGITVTLGTPPNTNTTYDSGTTALLNTGTDAENRVWSASALASYTNNKFVPYTGATQTLNLGNNTGIFGRNQYLSNFDATGSGMLPLWLLAIGVGAPLYDDPTFISGMNNTFAYNNSTIVRESNTTSNNGSNMVLKITTTSSGANGFYQTFDSVQNGMCIQVFRAKIPVGYTIYHYENATGTGATSGFLTPQVGTGKWEWYVRINNFGDSGSFNNAGHIGISGSQTASNPVVWYVSYLNAFNITNQTLANTKRYGWREFGLGRDFSIFSELSIDNPSYHSSGFYSINQAAGYPQPWGSSLVSRKNNNEWVELFGAVTTSEFYLRNQGSGFNRIWHSGNFDPSSLSGGGTPTRLRSNGNAYVSGDITLTAGTNVTMSQSGNVITVNASNTNTVTRLRANNNTLLSGDVTLTAGSNVTLTQSASVITINATNTDTVTRISANDNANLTGNVNFVGSGGTSVFRSGNSIYISSSSSGGGGDLQDYTVDNATTYPSQMIGEIQNVKINTSQDIFLNDMHLVQRDNAFGYWNAPQYGFFFNPLALYMPNLSDDNVLLKGYYVPRNQTQAKLYADYIFYLVYDTTNQTVDFQTAPYTQFLQDYSYYVTTGYYIVTYGRISSDSNNDNYIFYFNPQY